MARATVAALVILLLAHVAAQQPPPAPANPTFRTTTRLIVQTVTVKDKDGKTIEGLKPADFVVTEDGEPQTVSFAEFQKLPAPSAAGAVTVADELPPLPPVAPKPAAAAVAAPTDVKITGYMPGDDRYRNRE